MRAEAAHVAGLACRFKLKGRWSNLGWIKGCIGFDPMVLDTHGFHWADIHHIHLMGEPNLKLAGWLHSHLAGHTPACTPTMEIQACI